MLPNTLSSLFSCSVMSSSATPCTVAHQAPLSMGFPRQAYWSGLPFPSPGDLPDPGIKPMSPALQCGLYHGAARGALPNRLSELKIPGRGEKKKKSQVECQLIITSPSFIFLIWAKTPRAYVSLLLGLVGVCKGRGQKACDRREVRFRCLRA